jgi:hypothetical protein
MGDATHAPRTADAPDFSTHQERAMPKPVMKLQSGAAISIVLGVDVPRGIAAVMTCRRGNDRAIEEVSFDEVRIEIDGAFATPEQKIAALVKWGLVVIDGEGEVAKERSAA